jgi:putative transposase
VSVAGRGGRKLSIAGIAAYRAGQRSRLLYRVMVHRGRKGEAEEPVTIFV